jgi:hypothetical protein
MENSLSIGPRKLSHFALFAVAVAIVLTGIIVYRDAIWRTVSAPVMVDVVIASVPSQAEAFIDGAPVGKTPLKVPVKQGQHSVELRRPGYVETSRAFYAAYIGSLVAKTQIVERELTIELKPVVVPSAPPASVVLPSPMTSTVQTVRDPAIEKQISDLRSMIMANPGESITVGALQERVRLQSDEIKSLRDDVRDVREQSKWFIGALVTVLVGVVAAVFAVLQAFPRKGSDG